MNDRSSEWLFNTLHKRVSQVKKLLLVTMKITGGDDDDDFSLLLLSRPTSANDQDRDFSKSIGEGQVHKLTSTTQTSHFVVCRLRLVKFTIIFFSRIFISLVIW